MWIDTDLDGRIHNIYERFQITMVFCRGVKGSSYFLFLGITIGGLIFLNADFKLCLDTEFTCRPPRSYDTETVRTREIYTNDRLKILRKIKRRRETRG